MKGNRIETLAIILGVPMAVALAYAFCSKKKLRRVLAIEVGGTFMRAAIVLLEGKAASDLRILGEIFESPTGTPEDAVLFIKTNFTRDSFDAIGISSFGPIGLTEGPLFGAILAAPSPQKKSWLHWSLASELRNWAGKPVKVDTDVNASALCEFRLGDHGAISSLAYITAGTGVGVGLVIDGKPVHGFQHPEGGHLP